jgi:hypothetical protein
MQITSNIPGNDNAAYLAAVAFSERRALHSFFAQHVLVDAGAGYITIDEGNYEALPVSMIDRVIHTVHGAMSDEF